MNKMSIGDRMKENYENRYRFKLSRRTPVIMRLDGKAFHSLTKRCEKPFDEDFSDCMRSTVLALVEDIQGAKCAYQQSDEISILLTDFDNLATEAWLDYNIQKMTSISAGLASVVFTHWWRVKGCAGMPIFDSRVFNIPESEVCNYFVWRQKDWIRNSVQMLGRAHFSHSKMKNKANCEVHDMLHTKGINWAKLEPKWKNGMFLYKQDRDWLVNSNEIFTENRDSIERYLTIPDK